MWNNIAGKHHILGLERKSLSYSDPEALWTKIKILTAFFSDKKSFTLQMRSNHKDQKFKTHGKSGGRRRLYCFRVFGCDRVIMTVWRHIATTQSFGSHDQFSVEKPWKSNKERANTGFCSALVKQFVVSVQALLLILFVCKSCVCFVRSFVLNSTPIHFGSVTWAPFWTRN